MIAAAPAARATTEPRGLSAAEVAGRREHGQTNATSERTSRSVAKILRNNLFTRFNFIRGTLLVTILIVGQPQDAVFGIILVSNTGIGIAQELRAKMTLDRLAVLNEPHVRVIRDGTSQNVKVEDLVLDDLVDLRTGDQLVADGVVQDSTGMQVDESLLTGEAEPVDKRRGANVLSGSFIVAGSGRYQATAVGDNAYARRLTIEAQRFELARSELIAGINRVLRYVTFAIGPVALLTVISQLHSHSNIRDALTSTVAALVGMVPQGLVLLTSIAFGVAAVTLARRNVLVQQLPAVEGLARVDVVCFDKAGTITDGNVAFDNLVTLDSSAPVAAALGALADDENRNATLTAVAERFPPTDGWQRMASVPFSSSRKWSAATFDGQGTWVLGAPEIVLSGTHSAEVQHAAGLASSGARVLVLTRTGSMVRGESLPSGLRPVAFVVCTEQVRPEGAATIAYFTQQGVSLKVISGDSPNTVGAVAARVGIPGADHPVDARHLPADADALAQVLHERSVFGRVTPDQKQAIVTALQHHGHTVAMTGDGVNDALALKLADVGIAMGSGAPATKAVAEMLLAVPFTWWKALLVAASLTGFALVFVVQPVRTFYALQLPPPGQLAATVAIAAVGLAALIAFWLITRRLGHAPVAVVRQAAVDAELERPAQ